MLHDPPTFGSLFAGIGGIDLGLERAGFRCRWQVEYDPFCTRVLTAHWPDVARYGDIRSVDWSTIERVDLLAGGFPCQPVSVAGAQRAQADERWLWPEFARAIRELRPGHVLVENVPGLLGAHGGFGDVLRDLAVLGFDAEWFTLSAADVGAPHLRKRVFVVAHAGGERRFGRPGQFSPRRKAPIGFQASGLAGDCGPVPDTVSPELRLEPGRSGGAGGSGQAESRDDGPTWSLADTDCQPDGRLHAGRPDQDLATQPSRGGKALANSDGKHEPEESEGYDGEYEQRAAGRRGQFVASGVGAGGGVIGGSLAGRDAARRAVISGDPCDGAESLADAEGGSGDGIDAGWWTTEPDVGRVAHGVPSRVDRLRSLGNAVVPQVAEVIGRRLFEEMIDA